MKIMPMTHHRLSLSEVLNDLEKVIAIGVSPLWKTSKKLNDLIEEL